MGRVLLLTLAGLLVGFNSLSDLPSAQAEEVGITPVGPGKDILSAIDRSRELVKAKKATLNESQIEEVLQGVIRPLFDFSAMARLCLGNNRRQANDVQMAEFENLFSDMLSRTYIGKIRRGIEENKVRIDAEDINGDRARVKSIATDSKGDTLIDYSMHKVNGVWLIYDVRVENVGLVTTYRDEYGSIIRKDGMEGLLVNLRKKLAERKIEEKI